jgi:phosphatidylglycerophosphate synthase
MGSLAAILFLSLTHTWFRIFRAFAIAAAVVAVLSAIVITGRGRYVDAAFARWDRRFGTKVRQGRVARFIADVERLMLDLVRGNPRRLVVLLMASVVSYALMALEAWIILRAGGTSVSATAALAVETFSRVASFASAFIPANLGALEAMSLAAANAAGVASAGAALALARRIRGLFWAGAGLAIYPGRRPQARHAADVTRRESPKGPVLLYVMRDPAVAVSPHVRLAALPLSERILRAAFKAGYARVIVWRGVSTEDDQPLISAARRFGSRVTICSCDAEWQAAIDTLPGGTVATAIGAGTLVSPALLMEAPAIAAPPGQPRDVPAGGDWRVSGVIRVRASDARNVAALAAALRSRLEIGERPTGQEVASGAARLAIRMIAPSDVPLAEQTLRRSNYKSTDSKIARWNRQISLPISVALMRTPLTANQLSVILIAVGFYSGWLFSIGAYWPGVLAAFLSLAASILDGCDGEIARLKYEESAPGCWIETFGDYSYYIAIFVGLTIGAVRQTGSELFYWIGASALAGTLVTFAFLVYLRARITNGNPSRLHSVARARFTAEPTWWSRLLWRVSFVATRAAMPYGIFVLALANLLPVVVVLAAVGSNLYWVSLVLKLKDLLRSDETVAA